MDNLSVAESAIGELEALSNAYAECIGARMDLETAKPIEKSEAILRIMDARQVAATPAEKLVETDERYASFLKSIRIAVVNEAKARGRVDAAKVRARLAVVRVEVAA